MEFENINNVFCRAAFYIVVCAVLMFMWIGGIPGAGNDVHAQRAYSILCLGESTTVKGGDLSYPSQLEDILNKNKKGLRFNVINAGNAEADTSDIAAALPGRLKQFGPDMIVVMVGINDGASCADYSNFTRLGWFYNEKGDHAAAIESFRKAIAAKPAGYREHTEFGIFYLKSGNFKEAEKLLTKAVAINRRKDEAYIVLGWCYLEQNRFSEAEASFKKALELHPQNPDVLGAFAVLCGQKGDHDSAQRYYEQASLLRMRQDNPASRDNFKRLKEIASESGIPIVFVQYPMRSVSVLKKMIDNPDRTVLFVDNEKRFKDAVRQHGYREYFEDMFAGDFGHCTAKGNYLLADTVAAAILHYYSG